MAVKVVSNNVRKNFQVTCPTCGAEIQYADSDIRYHRNFPEGYIVCPRCHRNIAQGESKVISEEEIMEPVKDHHRRIRGYRIAGKAFLITGIVCLSLGGLFSLLAFIFWDEGYFYIPLLIYGILFLAIGIPLFVLKFALWNKKIRQLKKLDGVK